MTLNTYKTIGFIVFLLIIGTNKSIAQNTKKPNIIFIMTDDQSAVVPLDSEKRINRVLSDLMVINKYIPPL